MTAYSLPTLAHTIADSQRRNNAVAVLFGTALAAGQQRQFWSWLTRRSAALRPLPAGAGRGQGGRHAGRKSVALADIRGSEGRTKDFDDRFNPLSGQTRQRWQSVANALEDGVQLPPVELIQVGAAYYVRDGHHRISVSAALGLAEIEAVVTQWNAD
jgi:hypothetical protein